MEEKALSFPIPPLGLDALVTVHGRYSSVPPPGTGPIYFMGTRYLRVRLLTDVYTCVLFQQKVGTVTVGFGDRPLSSIKSARLPS